jgi:hypothetical protein
MFTWHVLMATGFWMAYLLYTIWCFAPTLVFNDDLIFFSNFVILPLSFEMKQSFTTL